MTTTTTTSPTTGAPRRLQRSNDKTLGGVAAGFADYLDVDVTVVRLAFVALTVFGGAGPIIYVASWLIMPAPPAVPAAQPPAPQAPAPEAATPQAPAPQAPAPADAPTDTVRTD